MKFVFEVERSEKNEATLKATFENQWSPRSTIPLGLISEYLSEEKRLAWAPVLLSLAFGEATAFQGFGKRIEESCDMETKLWLSAHLLDEGRHTEGFSYLMNYLYPSYTGRHEQFFNSRDVYVFYGRTERTITILHWLICTQIAEIYGKYCYSSIRKSLKREPVIENFFQHILVDEGRHISYVNHLISQRLNMIKHSKKQLDDIKIFTEKMSSYAEQMFIGRNLRSFDSMEIDARIFCSKAKEQIYFSIIEKVNKL